MDRGLPRVAPEQQRLRYGGRASGLELQIATERHTLRERHHTYDATFTETHRHMHSDTHTHVQDITRKRKATAEPEGLTEDD